MAWAPGPHTRLAGVIGHPIRHSRSPAIHNAAYRVLGLDWAYLAFDVAPGAGAAAVGAVRSLGLAGLNVTMPHKHDAARAADRCSPVAETLAAVNTVVPVGDELEGHNTDGAGLLAALAADHGFEPCGQRCLVLGAGGAARAVVLALAGAGATEVEVVARRLEQARAAARLAGGVGRVGTVDGADGADLVVNATPVTSELPLDLDPARLGRGQLVVDLGYQPRVTALLEAAATRGARTANGLGMLVHQAALSFRLLTGEDAPLSAMAEAAFEATPPGPEPEDGGR
ncbi:MAG: shikimate dehydrogenase [Actinobacteria bacterium]|nr:shikimate dehydrogenase [Actinomycetota bacterium]